MKCIVFFFLLFFALTTTIGQSDSIRLPKSAITAIKKNAAPKPIINDTTTQIASNILKDSAAQKKNLDSVTKLKTDSIANIIDTSDKIILRVFPLYNTQLPQRMYALYKEPNTKDLLFYLLLFIVFLAALVQVVFPRYFKNVFNIFLQTSVRQKQTREQLSQDNVAALLLNVLFIISSSTLIALIFQNVGVAALSFWQVFAFANAGLASIYLFKLGFTQFMGWVFNKQDVSVSYSFIVFVINKIIGVLLIPFLFLITFSTAYLSHLALIVSLFLIGFLFIFRFFSTYKNLGNRLKINAIHFFLYFCSVEILPLLIMYKLLSNYISNGI